MSNFKPVRLDLAPMPVPKLKENPTLNELLSVIQRRGGYRTNNDPAVAQFEMMRATSEWSGQPSEAQVTTLKRNAMLILDVSKLNGVIDLENRKVNLQANLNRIPVSKDQEAQLVQMVAAVLGEGWTVTCGMIASSNDPGPAKPRRSAPKRKGAGRPKKTRKRRK